MRRFAGSVGLLAFAVGLHIAVCPAFGQTGAATGGGSSSMSTAAPSGTTAGVTDELPYTNQYWGEYFTSDLTEVFRVKHIEGDGQGDVPAFTDFGFTKFGWTNDGVLMLDLVGRITNEADPGLSAGIHRRVFVNDVLVGGGGFYDWQNDFQQASFALELFLKNWSFRTNGYFVLGDDVETDSDYQTTGATNIYFQGNNILADNLLLVEEHEVALSGIDFEVARHIGRASDLFVGGYVLDGDFDQHTVGGKGGVRGFLMPDIAATVTVSSDDLFGTNVYGGVTWFVGARGGLSRPNMARRIIMPVERNEQVAIANVRRVEAIAGPIVLTHDDDEIEIVHIDSNAAAGDGTIGTPFNDLPATLDADIVYVHGNSMFTNLSYTVAEDQRFLGESAGVVHLVETDQLGEIVLPAVNGGARPIIQSALGDAVVLGGGDTEVSNFDIRNAAGNGIFGEGITDFNINRNVISSSGLRGIYLKDISGALDEEAVATGEITDNVVTNSNLHNIQLVIAGEFEGEVSGNAVDGNISANSNGIDISGTLDPNFSGPFIFRGEIENNTANNHKLNGIVVNVDEFDGEISGNTAIGNAADGLNLTFGIFDGDVEGNTANSNGDNGIDFSITGNFFSEADVNSNTTNLNTAEGIYLHFSGTGTSAIKVVGNNLSGNNGGFDREFLAENEDVFGNRPVVFIRLDGNTSTNVPIGGSFNYEFDNNDLFADGEMFLDVGTNVGTVEVDEDVEPDKFPFD